VPYRSRRRKTRIKTHLVLLAVILAVLGGLLGAKSLGLAGGSDKAACGDVTQHHRPEQQ
jgi:hypothetical protein